MGWNGWDSGYYYSGAFNTDKGPETDFEKTRSNSKEDGNFRYKLSAITEIRKEIMNTRGLFCFEAPSLYLPNVPTRYGFGKIFFLL